MRRTTLRGPASSLFLLLLGTTLMAACTPLQPVQHQDSPLESAPIIAADAWPDECQAVPGYAEFRAAFVDAVTRRDAAAFRSLFSVRGRMHIAGLELQSEPARWSPDDASSAGPWTELNRMLPLGCSRDGERLLIPYVARFGESEGFTDSTAVALKPGGVFQSPNGASPTIARLSRGESVQITDWSAGSGWVGVGLDHRRSGYVRLADVRTLGDAVLKMTLEDGRWRIVWFGGYD